MHVNSFIRRTANHCVKLCWIASRTRQLQWRLEKLFVCTAVESAVPCCRLLEWNLFNRNNLLSWLCRHPVLCFRLGRWGVGKVSPGIVFFALRFWYVTNVTCLLCLAIIQLTVFEKLAATAKCFAATTAADATYCLVSVAEKKLFRVSIYCSVETTLFRFIL